MSAVFSADRVYRWRLDRHVSLLGTVVYGYFGVNGSSAGESADDQTVKKWIGFSERNNARRFIVGNAFGLVATDVRKLAAHSDPVGPDNDRYLAEVIAEADVLVPCWGSRTKLPAKLRPRLDFVRSMLIASGKPVRVFGPLTASGDPSHPLRLPYSTPLVEWAAEPRLPIRAQGG